MTRDSNESERDDGVWRDETKLPLSGLVQALATYSQDGQVDDVTGADAGAEYEFGDAGRPVDRDARPYRTEHTQPGDDIARHQDPDPDTEAGRRVRPSPDGSSSTGRRGPH